MKPLIFILCLLFAFAGLSAQTKVWQPSLGHVQIPIWPGAVPNAGPQPTNGPENVKTEPIKGGTRWLAANNVTRPTITVYSPKGTNAGVADVVLPGGGYTSLAMDLEGTEICDWLTSRGITAVLLKYRVPVNKEGVYEESRAALQDAQRALSLVRFRAADWRVDPHKIGVIGFSAGGHLVAATSTRFDKRTYPEMDAADKESCRPDFAIALYPGHLQRRVGPLKLNPNISVTSNTPPTFLVHAQDDRVDPVFHSVVYYIALKNAGVPVEMHLYAQGGHAFGLRRPEFPIAEWPRLVEKWLGTIGMISK